MTFATWAAGLFFPLVFMGFVVCDLIIEWLNPCDDEEDPEQRK